VDCHTVVGHIVCTDDGISKHEMQSSLINVRHRCHDNKVSTSFLSDLWSSSRSEAMVLVCLDLGALAL
jgi:hypothetical protein